MEEPGERPFGRSAGSERAGRTPTRFERKVDRSGEHHLWTGARDPNRGTGRIKVDSRSTAAHRVAWELAHGPLAPGARVRPCPTTRPACGSSTSSSSPRRALVGDGSARSMARCARCGPGHGSCRSLRQAPRALAASTRRSNPQSARRPRRAECLPRGAPIGITPRPPVLRVDHGRGRRAVPRRASPR